MNEDVEVSPVSDQHVVGKMGQKATLHGINNEYAVHYQDVRSVPDRYKGTFLTKVLNHEEVSLAIDIVDNCRVRDEQHRCSTDNSTHRLELLTLQRVPNSG